MVKICFMMMIVDNLEGIAHLPKRKRNEIIVSALQKRARMRQLERITGIGFGIMQRLKTKTYQKLRPRDLKTYQKLRPRDLLEVCRA